MGILNSFFKPNPNTPQGLVTPENQRAAVTQGLLAAAQAFHKGGTPSRTPQSMGATVADALGGSMKAYQNHTNNSMNQNLQMEQVQKTRDYDKRMKQFNTQWADMFKPKEIQYAGGDANAYAQSLEASKPIYKLSPNITPEQAALVKNMDPMQGIDYLGQLRNKEKAVNVAKGGALVDPSTGEVIYNNVDTSESAPHSKMGKIARDRRNGDMSNDEYEKAMMAMMKPLVSNNTDYAKEAIAKLNAKFVVDMRAGVSKLRATGPDLVRIRKALENFTTGPTADARLLIGGIASEFGVQITEGQSEGEIIKSIQSRLAPAMRVPGSGHSSDRDVQMFLDALPNLMRTKEGNIQVINHLEKIIARKDAELGVVSEWFDTHGGSLSGVEREIDKKLGGSIFTTEDVRSFQGTPTSFAPPPVHDPYNLLGKKS